MTKHQRTKYSKLILFSIIVSAQGFYSGYSQAAVASEGRGWDALEQRIDTDIGNVMQSNHVVGMTVAVSKKGRLILSKGYGEAKRGGTQMKPDMRTRIGSVSKVVATGAAGIKLVNQKGIDPTTKHLYGDDSIFGNHRFSNYMRIGVKRYSPIVAMAIAPDNKVYTWYQNGKVSVGTTSDLDRYQAPRSFILPEGRRVAEIRDIGIARDSTVHVWYNDSSKSVGQSRDLGAYVPKVLDDKGKVVKVRHPAGKSMLNVIGIAIAKSDDHVYAWYDDGTVSSGSSMNFTRYYTNRPYTADVWSRYIIRAMGIASDDHVYTWDSRQYPKVQSGSSQDLSKYREPYIYSIPQLQLGENNVQNWYYDITLQNILDHRAGFQKDGDQPGAADMFWGTPDQETIDEYLTYEDVHNHFLATRPLRWKPNGGTAYSNHGFGIWTLIIEELSGKTYRDYVSNNFLNPIGVRGDIRPQKVNPDSKDATPYSYNINNGSTDSRPFKDSGLGLAAGGWTAAAQTLLKITDHLDNIYTTHDLQNMGWHRETRGKLHHNGVTGGGTAYVVMFPDGYTSVSGANLSDVHIAIAANTNLTGGDEEQSAALARAMDALASRIALEVPQSNVSRTYDIWN